MSKQHYRRTKASTDSSKRKHTLVCLMSDDELRIVERYLEKYKISNKSRWFREVVLSYIYRNLEEDYPTLFDEHDMRR